MENLQEFIKNYFSLLNVRNMPETVFNRYKKYIKDNDFPNKNVKSWSTKLMDLATNTWKDLPDFSTLSDDELNLLYVDLLRTLGAMSAHTNNMDDDTKTFINTYYGTGKLFDVPPISGSMKQQIDGLINLVLNDSTVASLASLDWGEDEILDAVSHGRKKHESDDVRRLVFKIVKNLQQALQDQQYQQYLAPLLSPFNLNGIQKAIKPFGIDDVTLANRDALKAGGAKIFETLFKKDKIRDAFKKYEPGEKFVSEQIEVALSDTDYTGKINEKNYIAPQYKDDKNLRQKIDEALENTYNDVLKKYLTLHRANLFIKPEAKAIFGALDEAKIKPTDGIGKILEIEEKSGDITKALKGKQPFGAADHFKWMTDKLADYQKNGMGKAIAGALRNGHQMRHVIEQLVIDAVKEGKTKEAKTAMEVLSVMQYGMFTSRTMDAINQTDVIIFSDGKLSWNKNEGIQFVTKAADRTLKAGIQLGGYAATAVVNKLRRVGSTFHHSGELNKKSEARKTELITQKADFNADKTAKDAADDALIRTETARRTGTGITDLDASKNKLERDRITESRRKMVYDGRQRQLEALEKVGNDYNERQNLANQLTLINNEGQILKNDLLAMPDPADNQYDIWVAETKRQRFNQIAQEGKQIIDKITEIESHYTDLDAEYNSIYTVVPPATQSRYDKAMGKLNSAQTAYENQRDANNDLADKINIYEETTENIDTAQRQKAERQEAADKWDDNNKNEYLELMGYWDFLQSGRTKSLFHWSTKSLQKKMDSKKTGHTKTRMDERYLYWMQQHNYAA